MSNIVKVVIELNYDMESFNDTLDEPMTQQEFVDYVSDELVYDDLTDLMRGDRLKHWAEVTVVDEFGELVATQ
jgi:hypothetical protein